MSKPHKVLNTSQTAGEEVPGQVTNPTADPTATCRLGLDLHAGTLTSENLCRRPSGGFALGGFPMVRCLCFVGGGSQSPTQQVGTDRGVPWASPGNSPKAPQSQANPTPPSLPPCAPTPVRPPGSLPSSPRSSLAQRQPRRARFNWGLWDVRTRGPRARAAGGGGTRLSRPWWQPGLARLNGPSER